MFARRFDKTRIILGGGPVGSSLAKLFAESHQSITLVYDPSNFGSHHDVSRLSRLAYEGDDSEFERSYEAVRHLTEINAIASSSVITSKPGVVFIASEGTLLAQQLDSHAHRNFSLTEITSDRLRSIFPSYPINVPQNTRLWLSKEGYVVNPQNLSLINRKLAAQAGCEIVLGKAKVSLLDNQYHVTVNDDTILQTKELYLLAGAANKEIFYSTQLKIPEFSATYLTAISTLRYRLRTEPSLFMPIVIGSLYLPEWSHPLDFSTMPEGLSTIKTRLSGPVLSEEIKIVDEKNNFDNEKQQMEYIKLFSKLFPFLLSPYDFRRCITYRNNGELINGLSFLAVEHMRSVNSVSRKMAMLTTTLGCYGVHVKYGHILAKAMQQRSKETNSLPGFCMNVERVASSDFVSDLLPKHISLLNESGLNKKIGRTAVKKIADNFFMKLEGFNWTGSIKDRVALYVLLKKIENREIKNNDVVVTASSGSYGVSLFELKKIIEKYWNITFTLVIVVPYAYRNRESIQHIYTQGVQEVLEKDLSTTKLFLKEVLLYTSGNFSCAIDLANKISKNMNHVIISQQYDELHVEAHKSTAQELAEQLPEVTDVVLTVGTGATASGIHRFFPKKIKVHCQPAESGIIPGLTDPSTYNNYFKPNFFCGYQQGKLDFQKAFEKKRIFKSQHGFDVGPSTGAALDIAERVREKNHDAVVAVISPSFV